MRFALLGDDPDGLEMARTLVASGRHELAAYHGPGAHVELLRWFDLQPQVLHDLEEVLADPLIEAVIVAGVPSERAEQLRRAVQSEHHVLCVCPVAETPDIAHEAVMIASDTRRVVFPLLPESLHPGVIALAQIAKGEPGPFAPIGNLRMIDMYRSSTESVLIPVGGASPRFGVPGWDVLRALGGDVAELCALAAHEELLVSDEPLVVTGRFESGLLFQGAYLSQAAESFWRMTLIGSQGRSELVIPDGWPGHAFLTGRNERGETQEKSWESANPWVPLLEAFENAVAGTPVSATALSWQTEIRCLELDDAARRSLARRRVSTLEYPEPTEEVGFKGTMTMVGCGLFWVILVLLILARWFPWLGFVIVLVLIFFLGLQVLRWLVPSAEKK
jgi:predicted dehydrogenase